jgi:hypothetical protein
MYSSTAFKRRSIMGALERFICQRLPRVGGQLKRTLDWYTWERYKGQVGGASHSGVEPQNMRTMASSDSTIPGSLQPLATFERFESINDRPNIPNFIHLEFRIRSGGENDQL